MSHCQLVQAGIHPDQIKRWARRGLLIRLYVGVYAVGHVALSPVAKLQAAHLACGSSGLFSHATAAFLWGLHDHGLAAIDITIVSSQLRPKPGIRLHRLSSIDAQDVRRRQGLPLTSPARTLIDLAVYVSPDELDRLVAEARAQGLLRTEELDRALQRAGHRRGVGHMRAFLATEGEPALTRSEAERRLRTLLRQARLPQPGVNMRLAGYEVDFVWQAEKLVVELDGFRFHSHRRAFERDRKKDMALADAGYQVIRVTWRQLVDEPLAVIAHIARALERRRRAAG